MSDYEVSGMKLTGFFDWALGRNPGLEKKRKNKVLQVFYRKYREIF
jgi:hypothetical protein